MSSPPYWTHKTIGEDHVNRLTQRLSNTMINLDNLIEPDSEENVYTQAVVTKTKDKLFALTNPKGGRLSNEIQLAQEFAIQQLDHYISFQSTNVNWESVCNPLCKTKTADELHLSVNFLNNLLESFRNSDRDMEPIIKSIIAKNPSLQDFYSDMLTTNDETVLYDKLQESKKELMEQQRILELKIKILSTLKKKHHPLRLSVKPVMKFIRDIEDRKKDNVDIDEQPKKKQKTFTDILGDYFGVNND